MSSKKHKYNYKFIHSNNISDVDQIDAVRRIYRNFDKNAKFRTISVSVNGKPSLVTFVYVPLLTLTYTDEKN